MTSDGERTEGADELLVKAFAKLDSVALGVAIGVVTGLSVALATLFLVAKGGEVVGPNLALLGQYFLGYTVTLAGALIGSMYGFVLGFVVGFVFAGARNIAIAAYLSVVKTRQELTSFHDNIDPF